MDGTGVWNPKVGIIRFSRFILGQGNAHLCLLGGAEGRGLLSGFAADGNHHMLVTDLCGDSALGKVFGVGSVSSRILVADAVYRQLAGFAADDCSLHTVRRGEARIGKALVNSGHDLSPDILVEAGSAIVGGAAA